MARPQLIVLYVKGGRSSQRNKTESLCDLHEQGTEVLLLDISDIDSKHFPVTQIHQELEAQDALINNRGV